MILCDCCRDELAQVQNVKIAETDGDSIYSGCLCDDCRSEMIDHLVNDAVAFLAKHHKEPWPGEGEDG